jgi:hypothetical protein
MKALKALIVRHEIVDLIETHIVDEDTRDLALSFLRDDDGELLTFPTLEEEANGIAWAMALIATLEPNEFPERDSCCRLVILDALGQAFTSCQGQRALQAFKRASVN